VGSFITSTSHGCTLNGFFRHIGGIIHTRQ
jgi:hypothetical protein